MKPMHLDSGKLRLRIIMSFLTVLAFVSSIQSNSLAQTTPQISVIPTEVPGVTLTGYTSLNGIDCVGEGVCFAVGSTSAQGYPQGGFMEEGIGTSWIPILTGALRTSVTGQGNDSGTSLQLNDISCASEAKCWAVGSDAGSAFVGEYESGVGFTASTIPQTVPFMAEGDASELNGVACTSSNYCIAVGNSLGGTISLQYNGIHWKEIATPTQFSYGSSLLSISCVTSRCWSVGTSEVAGATIPLIEYFDGSTWSVRSSPVIGSSDAQLQGISCIAITQCYAVGTLNKNGTFGPLAEEYEQSKWVVNQFSPRLVHDFHLTAVSCVSFAQCYAVGSDGTKPVVLHSENGSWKLISQNYNTNKGKASFNGISCTRNYHCWAVGTSISSIGQTEAIDDYFDGTKWNVMPPLFQIKASESMVESLACPSSSACVANVSATPFPSYNVEAAGGSWKFIASLPTTVVTSNELDVLTCNTPRDCWGEVSPANGQVTSLAHWNGVSWEVDTLQPQNLQPQISSISCIADDNCFAVGWNLNQEDSGIIYHYNGTSWVLLPTIPKATGPDGALYSISCIATGKCWAIGVLRNRIVEVLEYAHGTWEFLPNVPKQSPIVFASNPMISCLSSYYCWAISDDDQLLFYNGRSWTASDIRQMLSLPSNQFAYIQQLYCFSTSRCFFVGEIRSSGNPNAGPIGELYNGTGWQALSIGAPSSISYSSIACTSQSSCWLAGQYVQGGENITSQEVFPLFFHILLG